MATIAKPIRPVRSVKTGKLDAQCAIKAMAAAGIRIIQINRDEIGETTGESSAAIKPRIVIGATKGAASKFAITLIGAK